MPLTNNTVLMYRHLIVQFSCHTRAHARRPTHMHTLPHTCRHTLIESINVRGLLFFLKWERVMLQTESKLCTRYHGRTRYPAVACSCAWSITCSTLLLFDPLPKDPILTRVRCSYRLTAHMSVEKVSRVHSHTGTGWKRVGFLFCVRRHRQATWTP